MNITRGDKFVSTHFIVIQVNPYTFLVSYKATEIVFLVVEKSLPRIFFLAACNACPQVVPETFTQTQGFNN